MRVLPETIASLVRMPAISLPAATARAPYRAMKTCTELSSCTPKRRSTRGPAARPMPYAQRSPASANAHATAPPAAG